MNQFCQVECYVLIISQKFAYFIKAYDIHCRKYAYLLIVDVALDLSKTSKMMTKLFRASSRTKSCTCFAAELTKGKYRMTKVISQILFPYRTDLANPATTMQYDSQKLLICLTTTTM